MPVPQVFSGSIFRPRGKLETAGGGRLQFGDSGFGSGNPSRLASGVRSGAEASGDVATVTLLEPPPSTTTESGRTVAPQAVSNLARLQFGDGRLQFGDVSRGRRKSGFRRVFVAGSFSPGPTIHPLRVPQGAVTNGARNRGEPGAKLETDFARFDQISPNWRQGMESPRCRRGS